MGDAGMKNAKLWKRVLHEGIRSWGERGENEQRLESLIVKTPIIVDDRYSEGDFLPKMPPSVAFPFHETWIEGYDRHGTRCGALINDGEKTPDGKPMAMAIIAGGYGPEALGQLAFDVKGGDIVPDTEVVAVHPSTPDHLRDSMARVTRGIVALALDSLFFLSCKNVDIAARDPEPKQARLARKRYGDTPHDYRYHVLVVRPAGSRSDAPAQEIGNMPRHVCRGHFAEYGPKYGKGLLFGKYEGRFYVPPHVKGKRENGVVEKDYEVRATR